MSNILTEILQSGGNNMTIMTDEQAIQIADNMFEKIWMTTARGRSTSTEQLTGILALGRVIAMAKDQLESKKNKGR